MHVGQNKSEGGRMGDHVAKGLSADFQKIGVELGRFKTGTPLDTGSSIDFSKTTEQFGDETPTRFSFTDTRTKEELFHGTQNKNVPCGTIFWPPRASEVLHYQNIKAYF